MRCEGDSRGKQKEDRCHLKTFSTNVVDQPRERCWCFECLGKFPVAFEDIASETSQKPKAVACVLCTAHYCPESTRATGIGTGEVPNACCSLCSLGVGWAGSAQGRVKDKYDIP